MLDKTSLYIYFTQNLIEYNIKGNFYGILIPTKKKISIIQIHILKYLTLKAY
jgi:hypothetical protein